MTNEKRYNKYLVRRNNPDYTRYKDSIWINKLNKVVIYIEDLGNVALFDKSGECCSRKAGSIM